MQLVFFLEEPSAKAMLQGLLPRLVPVGWDAKYIVFEGKQDLEKQLPRKLNAWLSPNCQFIVLRDKDHGDCALIRQNLVNICHDSGKQDTLVRLAIHELESWYLGDLIAVEKGLGISKLAKTQASQKFRNPDRLSNPSEELQKLTKLQYQKVNGSRAIGPYLSLENNCSISFKKFISGIKNILQKNYETEI